MSYWRQTKKIIKIRIRINKIEDNATLKRLHWNHCTRQSVYSNPVYWSESLILLFTEMANLSAVRSTCINNKNIHHHNVWLWSYHFVNTCCLWIKYTDHCSSGLKVEKQGHLYALNHLITVGKKNALFSFYQAALQKLQTNNLSPPLAPLRVMENKSLNSCKH